MRVEKCFVISFKLVVLNHFSNPMVTVSAVILLVYFLHHLSQPISPLATSLSAPPVPCRPFQLRSDPSRAGALFNDRLIYFVLPSSSQRKGLSHCKSSTLGIVTCLWQNKNKQNKKKERISQFFQCILPGSRLGLVIFLRLCYLKTVVTSLLLY